MRQLLLLLTLISTISISTIVAQDINTQDLENKIDALVPKTVNDTTPGFVLGIVHNGELIFKKGYGLANLSYNIPNSPNMVYNVGSVAKQFLGYAFAVMHQKGELNIDDPVSDYLDDWPEFDHKVTLRHLLTHTSGYREAYTMSGLAGRDIGVDRLSKEECLEVVRRQPKLEYVPGSRYTYNSTAWVILSEVFEKAIGVPAAQWVQNNILSPLNMNDAQIETFVGQVIQNSAESYSLNENGYNNQKSNRAIFGAADIFASIEDLAKWVNNYKTAQIGGQEVNTLFLDPFILNNGINSGYALGIGLATVRGLKRYRHTGGHAAFITQVSYYPEYDTGIITISNYGGRGRIQTAKIAEILLGKYMSDPEDYESERINLSSSELEKLTGKYLSESNNDLITITLEDNKLMESGDELIPVSRNEFRINGSSNVFTFSTSAKGDSQFFLKYSGDQRSYSRISNWNLDDESLSEFEGNYWSSEVETVYHFEVKDGRLVGNHRWNGEFSLTPVTQDIFSSNFGLSFVFTRNDSGQIVGFNANSGRTLNVFFEKN